MLKFFTSNHIHFHAFFEIIFQSSNFVLRETVPSWSLPQSLLLPFSAVDHSGVVASGQPLVNAIRTDSALIGGTEPVFYWTSFNCESQRLHSIFH